MSAVGTVDPDRPGDFEKLQYMFVYAMACSADTGEPHGRMSSVVWASATSVAS